MSTPTRKKRGAVVRDAQTALPNALDLKEAVVRGEAVSLPALHSEAQCHVRALLRLLA